MKTRIIDFDLEKAKAGAKVVTRDGRNVRILCYDVKGHVDFPILTLIDEGAYEATCFFTSKGKGISNIDNDSTLDLFIEEQVFEDGDFITFGEDKENPMLGIFKGITRDGTRLNYYLDYPAINYLDFSNWPTKNLRLATDEERQTLIEALAKEGKCWNAEKKCIETKTLIFKHFEKVLVRDSSNELWKADLFSYHTGDKDYPYQCCNQMWKQCIPFEGNEHLLGTIENLNL